METGSSPQKTAIICMGGGMRSAHAAGFLYSWARGGLPNPDMIIGTSGSAGTATYFAAGQYESIKNVWCERLCTKDFVSFTRLGKILDVDYLVDSIFKKQERLDTEKLAASPMTCLVPLTDAETGKTEYMDMRHTSEPFEVLRAAKAIPVFYGKKTYVHKRAYIDGEVGPTINDHVDFCITRGATRILVINDARLPSRLSSMLKFIFAGFQRKPIRDAMFHDFLTNGFVCTTGPLGTEVMCVFPGALPVSFITTQREKLHATFARGEERAQELKDELQRFFTVEKENTL